MDIKPNSSRNPKFSSGFHGKGAARRWCDMEDGTEMSSLGRKHPSGPPFMSLGGPSPGFEPARLGPLT